MTYQLIKNGKKDTDTIQIKTNKKYAQNAGASVRDSIELNINNPIITLFEYIRNHEWVKLRNLLEQHEYIDINLRDSNLNYLLTYAVRFNKPDIVLLLLQKGAKYDIVDKMEKSILYDAIKSNFSEIIQIILDFSEKNIGISVTNIRDLNGNILLHYAIIFQNIFAVKLLIKYKSNPYTTDIKGRNALHLAVINGSLLIVNCIMSIMTNTNINIKTSKGETALHIAINYQYNSIAKAILAEKADPNILDNENEFSYLHYAVGWNNLEIIESLMETGADPNIQDVYGNVPLMYCIKEDHMECFDKIIKFYSHPTSIYKLNFNLWNISGKNILHEALETYTESKKHYVDVLIETSGLSIQDSDGNTCLHYLVALNLWENYITSIKTKKLNIFAKNSSGKAVIDLIYASDKSDKQKIKSYNKFLDIITTGYIQTLKREKKTWINELDKICSRDFSELTDEEKHYIGNMESKKNSQAIDDGCFRLIRNKLIGDIKKYRDGLHTYCQRSYPSDKIQCIDVKEGMVLDVCTFTGSLLDVLIGLIFLLKKHANACTTLSNNHIKNDNLCKFYKSVGFVMNGRCDFLDFELVWVNYKLYMIDKFSELFNACIKSNARFIIIPIGIELISGAHANYLIFDKHVKEMERFEPHGGATPNGFNYNSHFLDDILSDYFKSIDKDIQYIRPHEYIPKIGFQVMDTQENSKNRIGDPGGFCALWSIWYVDQRLTYYTYDRTTLVNDLFENIKMQGISYRNMIRNYSRQIIKHRDDLLKKIDIDINDWLNDNYTHTQLDKFIAQLIAEINTCCVVKKNK